MGVGRALGDQGDGARRAAVAPHAPGGGLALFGIDDERQLDFPEDGQSRVVGDQVEAFDIVAFRVPGPDRFAAGIENRFANGLVNDAEDVGP